MCLYPFGFLFTTTKVSWEIKNYRYFEELMGRNRSWRGVFYSEEFLKNTQVNAILHSSMDPSSVTVPGWGIACSLSTDQQRVGLHVFNDTQVQGSIIYRFCVFWINLTAVALVSCYTVHWYNGHVLGSVLPWSPAFHCIISVFSSDAVVLTSQLRHGFTLPCASHSIPHSLCG